MDVHVEPNAWRTDGSDGTKMPMFGTVTVAGRWCTFSAGTTMGRIMGHPSAVNLSTPEIHQAVGTKHAEIRSFASWRKNSNANINALCPDYHYGSRSGSSRTIYFPVRQCKGSGLHPGCHRQSDQNPCRMAQVTNIHAVSNPTTGRDRTGLCKLVLE